MTAGGIDDDLHLFMGSDMSRGLLMIMPALQTWIAGEMEEQSKVDKEQRKAREERALLRAAAKVTPLAPG